MSSLDIAGLPIYTVRTTLCFGCVPFFRFVLSAVTPAVVVPSMLSLAERGYGVRQGIPTLVIAAASIDDVLAISGFTVILGVVFTHGMQHTTHIDAF